MVRPAPRIELAVSPHAARVHAPAADAGRHHRLPGLQLLGWAFFRSAAAAAVGAVSAAASTGGAARGGFSSAVSVGRGRGRSTFVGALLVLFAATAGCRLRGGAAIVAIAVLQRQAYQARLPHGRSSSGAEAPMA